MKNKFKITIPLAIVITLIAVIYQRSTGPTYPKKVVLDETAKSVRIKLPRSQGGKINAVIEIPKLYDDMTGTLTYKRFPTNDKWTTVSLENQGNRLISSLPYQPPAGKLIYYINLNYQGKKQSIASAKDPIFIRYKGEVPTFILAPHIFFMFLSMLFSSLAAFEAFYKTKSFVTIGLLTTGSLLVGGMMLGPLVQKYAFGVFWAGFPYDWDLTDNKLLISVIFWVGASLINFKKASRVATIVAACALLAMYSIPHSMMGSQYNYDKGQVETDK